MGLQHKGRFTSLPLLRSLPWPSHDQAQPVPIPTFHPVAFKMQIWTYRSPPSSCPSVFKTKKGHHWQPSPCRMCPTLSGLHVPLENPKSRAYPGSTSCPASCTFLSLRFKHTKLLAALNQKHSLPCPRLCCYASSSLIFKIQPRSPPSGLLLTSSSPLQRQPMYPVDWESSEGRDWGFWLCGHRT